MDPIPADVKTQAISANLKVLKALLAAAAKQSAEAYLLSQNGERNGAIGTVLRLDTILEDSKALYEVVITLHRLKG